MKMECGRVPRCSNKKYQNLLDKGMLRMGKKNDGVFSNDKNHSQYQIIG